ncbi:MAG: DUF1822 family protein [Cyanobacteria bacterium J06642_11]
MSYLQQDTNVTMLTWPITQQGQRIAQQFAGDHTHPAVAERVRRNTLAVWVIHDFFVALGIPTDLSASDSWNPVMQAMEDVADLVVPGVGRLECRPVSSEMDMYRVPGDALAKRIGYIAVVLDEGAGEAVLLGFLPEISPTQPQLKLGRLQPMEEFPHHLHQIRQDTTTSQNSQLTRLSQWLDGQVEIGWQLAEELLAQYTWTPAFRQAAPAIPQEIPQQIKRAKQLDLGLQLGTEQVALVLEVGQDIEDFINVGVRLYPLGGPIYLPEGLSVKVLDDTDQIYLTAQARSVDNYLQLYFRGHAGEPFTIQVSLGEVSLVEHFMI